MGLGFLEILIIAGASLILLGPSRLPSLMRQFARIYVQLRRTSNDFKSAFDHIVKEVESESLHEGDAPRSIEHKIGDMLEQSTLGSIDGQALASTLNRPAIPFDWSPDKGT